MKLNEQHSVGDVLTPFDNFATLPHHIVHPQSSRSITLVDWWEEQTECEWDWNELWWWRSSCRVKVNEWNWINDNNFRDGSQTDDDENRVWPWMDMRTCWSQLLYSSYKSAVTWKFSSSHTTATTTMTGRCYLATASCELLQLDHKAIQVQNFPSSTQIDFEPSSYYSHLSWHKYSMTFPPTTQHLNQSTTTQ